MSKRMIWCLIGLILALVVLPATHASFGSAQAGGSLKNSIHAVKWSGSVAGASAPSDEIPECASTPCDRFDLNVELPEGIWNN